MTTNETEEGVEITWKVPVVGKERLDVSFEIKGEGEIDAEALNRFHGAHFGDELESEDDQAAEETVEESAEEAVEEAAEEASEDEETEEAEEAEAPAIKFREDIMLRVMEEYGIEDRDAFLAHSMNFDLDDNGYLKKAEFVEAAKAFTADADESEAAEEESADAEEVVEEAAPEEVAEETAESKDCPICGTSNAPDASSCVACNYAFE